MKSYPCIQVVRLTRGLACMLVVVLCATVSLDTGVQPASAAKAPNGAQAKNGKKPSKPKCKKTKKGKKSKKKCPRRPTSPPPATAAPAPAPPVVTEVPPAVAVPPLAPIHQDPPNDGSHDEQPAAPDPKHTRCEADEPGHPQGCGTEPPHEEPGPAEPAELDPEEPGTGGGADQFLPWTHGVVHRVTQGNSSRYSHNTSYTRYGWDFALGYGEAVRTGIRGVVVSSVNGCHATRSPGCNYGWGNSVVIRVADGTCARFGHLINASVGRGATVSRYDVVGFAGSSGNSSGTHLHYQREQCGSQASIPSAFVEAGVPRTGQDVRSANGSDVPGPPPGPPQTSNHRIYANNPNVVTAGDTVNTEVVLRYDGPVNVPCFHARLGSVGDVNIAWADRSKPDFPNGTSWLTATRVIPHGCIGELRPGQDVHYTVAFKVPADAAPGTQRAARVAFVHEGRAWSGQQFDLLLNVVPAMRGTVVERAIDGSVDPGGNGTITVAMRNDGRLPWKRGELNLGTTSPRDSRFEFADESWIGGGSRIQLEEPEVAPGQLGHFKATYTVPRTAASGCRKLGLSPVWDGRYWLGGPDITLDACVKGPAPPDGTPNWRANYVGQETPRLIEPGQPAKFKFVVENTGRQTWDEHVHLGTQNPQDAAIRYAAEGVVGHRNRVQFTDEDGDGLVRYGERATFEYTIRPPEDATAAYRQYFGVVNDNGGPWFFQEAGIYAPVLIGSPSRWPFEVRASECSYELTAQSAPQTITDGQTGTFTWKVKNTSELCPWFRKGTRPFRLGTQRPQDAAAPFYTADDPAWLTSDRIQMQEEVVPPGGTATFIFAVTKPSGMGPNDDARLYADPVVDGLTWLRSIGMYAPIRVR